MMHPRREDPEDHDARRVFPAWSPGVRTLVVIGAPLAVAALVAWVVLSQLSSSGRLVDALGRASPAWVGVALVGFAALYLGYALIYRAVAAADGGPRPGVRISLRVAVTILGASVLATGVARVAAEYWSLRRMREARGDAWTRVLALNTAEWAALAAMVWLAAVALLAGAAGRVPFALELAWALLLPVCAASSRLLTARRFEALRRDEGRIPRRGLAAALRGIVLLRRLGASRGRFAAALGGGVLHWGGSVLIMWAALRSLGVPIAAAPLMVAFATGYVVTVLPLPAGGLGGVDAASTYALTLVGVSLAAALLATLILRVFTYWLPLLLALAGGLRVRRLGADLALVRGDEEAAITAPRPLVRAAGGCEPE